MDHLSDALADMASKPGNPVYPYGYSPNHVSWLLPPALLGGTDADRARALLTQFTQGTLQVRLAMTGNNAVGDGGAVVYGMKLAPLKEGQALQKMLMVRIRRDTGDFLDFQAIDRPNLPSVEETQNDATWEQRMRSFADRLFEPVAAWHAQAFGPGSNAANEDKSEWIARQLQSLTPGEQPSRSSPRM